MNFHDKKPSLKRVMAFSKQLWDAFSYEKELRRASANRACRQLLPRLRTQFVAKSHKGVFSWHIHHDKKPSPKRVMAFYGGECGIRTHASVKTN